MPTFVSWAASAAFSWIALVAASAAPDTFFRPDDVVAIVGGEDSVVLRDDPVFERSILQQPGLSGVKFRNLAFEGDTVFEQFRDLNFPSWEDQMKSTGATVIVAQFGKMESLQGPTGVTEFAAACENLLARMAGESRRVIVLSAQPPEGAAPQGVAPYNAAIRTLATKHGWIYVDTTGKSPAAAVSETLGFTNPVDLRPHPLDKLILKKNNLWFHYWHPQNWAFLHGDRTEQPSSRDHIDPTKRWFPEEMNQWLPLIAAQEKDIQQTLDADRKP